MGRLFCVLVQSIRDPKAEDIAASKSTELISFGCKKGLRDFSHTGILIAKLGPLHGKKTLVHRQFYQTVNTIKILY